VCGVGGVLFFFGGLEFTTLFLGGAFGVLKFLTC